MIGYITIGTNDLPAAKAFYDALFEGQEVRLIYENDTMVTYGFGRDKPALLVTKPYDGHPAESGNGPMVALSVADTDMVDLLHARALQLGALDEGAVGWRGDNFYGGYFRDLDGNKLNFYIWRS